MRKIHFTLVVASVLGAISFTAAPAAAYPSYSDVTAMDPLATNCAQCHGDFRAGSYTSPADGQSWGMADLHSGHTSMTSGTTCNACHPSGGGSTPVALSSSGGSMSNPALNLGCAGCHGRAETDPDCEGGAGLRQHHHNAGVTGCLGCHSDSDPAGGCVPVGEEVLPAYYVVGGGSIPTDSCNADGSEDVAGGPNGLDNDGDGDYDGADTDCMPMMDAGMPDAGMPDAGMPDAGMTDAGMTDAGTPVDGGSSTPDAGPPVDGGGSTPDAGTPPADGGGGGCNCDVFGATSSAPGVLSSLLVVGLAAFRRRRRAR